MDTPRIRPLGDQGLLVGLGDRIDVDVHEAVRRFARVLEEDPLPGMIEFVPTFAAVAIYLDPLRADPTSTEALINERLGRIAHVRLEPGRCITVPALYGGDAGPDLDAIAHRLHLAPEKVVRLHAATEYRVYMLGFTPGHAYLGKLPAGWCFPRRARPRSHVPPGSIGVANDLCCVYSAETPGGWHIIGRTPLPLFTPSATDPFLFRPGDRVRFQPITPQEYERIAGQVADGTYPFDRGYRSD